MFSMRIEDVVCSMIKEHFKAGVEYPANKALHFGFDVSLSDYELSPSKTERGSIHIIAHSLLGRHISIWDGWSRDCFAPAKKIDHWTFIGKHDDCWRDFVRGVFSMYYFEMAFVVNKDKAPAMLSENNHFIMGRPMVSVIDVEVSRDKTDENGYRQLIKVL